MSAGEAKAAVDALVLTDEERLDLVRSLGEAWQTQFAELGRAIQDPKVTKEETAAMQKRLGRLHQLQKKVAREQGN